jgi:hypothetical protein
MVIPGEIYLVFDEADCIARSALAGQGGSILMLKFLVKSISIDLDF